MGKKKDKDKDDKNGEWAGPRLTSLPDYHAKEPRYSDRLSEMLDPLRTVKRKTVSSSDKQNVSDDLEQQVLAKATFLSQSDVQRLFPTDELKKQLLGLLTIVDSGESLESKGEALAREIDQLSVVIVLLMQELM